MIRRDYLLRMLAEFFEVLSRMRSLKKGQQWQEAKRLAETEFKSLTGLGQSDVLKLSETELLACLIRSDSTLAVREKGLILATLLKEAGDIERGRNEIEVTRSLYLKGLNLLLGILAHEPTPDVPEFVPTLDAFIADLSDAPLPLNTQALLMQHYERSREFGRAEDLLFDMLDAQPGHSEILNFGVSFYRRIALQSDEVLAMGNLPRSELNESLARLLAVRPN